MESEAEDSDIQILENNDCRSAEEIKYVKCVSPLKFEYEEEVENEILPKWDEQITRIHTFTYVDGLSVMDGKIRRTKL